MTSVTSPSCIRPQMQRKWRHSDESIFAASTRCSVRSIVKWHVRNAMRSRVVSWVNASDVSAPGWEFSSVFLALWASRYYIKISSMPYPLPPSSSAASSKFVIIKATQKSSVGKVIQQKWKRLLLWKPEGAEFYAVADFRTGALPHLKGVSRFHIHLSSRDTRQQCMQACVSTGRKCLKMRLSQCNSFLTRTAFMNTVSTALR